MPLFTYIVTYKGATHVAQGSHSNFTGFVSTWASNIPQSALPGLTPPLHKQLVARAYEGTFAPVSGAKHVWRKSVDLGGSALTVIAIQTQQ
jgi:hypothetical protein